MARERERRHSEFLKFQTKDQKARLEIFQARDEGPERGNWDTMPWKEQKMTEQGVLSPQQLEQRWAEHLKGKFESKDVEAILATMVDEK